ncbi:TPA: DegT/DnrJ/EryC1/StrS family aminotransferase [Yersinia enterocolitica]
MIPIYQPNLSGKEKEYVNECLDTTWISSKGGFISRFEEAFSNYIGAKYATTVSNGTVALHLALESLGIGPGDEVIVPSLTYIASVNTVMQTGAKVIFVDSELDTWNIDVNDIRKKITPNTKAIMVVHLYGLPCNMNSIKSLCSNNNLLLIEDCAEAFGTKLDGQHVGTFGDVSTFSFFGNKTITTGEGGMVVCRDKEIYEKACHLKNQGVSSSREYWHDILAFNYRMTNICAAIGLAQLERADEIIAKKRLIANWYKSYLVNLPISVHAEYKHAQHSYWMCSILVNDPSKRDSLREYLKERNIETRPIFPPSHTMPHCFSPESHPVAENISSRGINLPSYPDLNEDNIKTICIHIRDFFS